MKYWAIYILLSIFLSSCFGLWWNEPSDRGLVEVSGEGFSLEVPANWQELWTDTLPIPKSWELVYALASWEERNAYLNNLIVLKSTDENISSSNALVWKSIGFLEQNMLNFTLISEEDISFLDEESWKLITFSARYNSQTPQAYYLQTARNCGSENFFITLSLTEELESYAPYEYILRTLDCG